MSEPPCLIDITLPFSERVLVWPGDAPVEIHRKTHVATVSELRMSSHAGTHLDAPAHFVPGGRTVEQLPLETLVGPAWVVDTDDARLVTAAALDRAGIPPGVERLLIKTRNSALQPVERTAGLAQFNEEFVALDASAAGWLLDQHVRLVGTDAPSVDPFVSRDFAVHRLLLGADLIIVENLVLQHVAAGAYHLICLPLRYEGGDGAPVRAVLETIRSE